MQIAADFAAAVRTRLGSTIHRLVLFGSRARGIAHPASDYDILVLLPARDSDSMRELYDEVTEFLLERGLDISLKVYAADVYERLRDLGTPFSREVEAHGLEL